MHSEPVDSPDAITSHEIIYDENNQERPAWKFCNSTKVPRSQGF